MEKLLLIIDDNKEIGEVVTEVIGDLFDRVINAFSVEEAEKHLEENTFAFIVLDINLEGRNGAEVIKFLHDTSTNPNKNVPVVIISGILTPQFIERNQHKFAGILMKPFDFAELTAIVENSLAQKTEIITDGSSEINAEDIPYLKCELPFPVPELETRVAKALDQVKKSAKLKSLFAQMKVDRSADNYILSHIGMLVNISTAISIKMEWDTDKTLEKFVYASYLHDMALAARPDLARINSLEIESKKESLSAADYKLVWEHPNIAANTLEEIREVPQDVAIIIRQHHEMPKENGFPTKCGHQKIVPLSTVFIVAHDLTEHILANPKWDMDDYIKLARVKFKGAHFSKILSSLVDCK